MEEESFNCVRQRPRLDSRTHRLVKESKAGPRPSPWSWLQHSLGHRSRSQALPAQKPGRWLHTTGWQAPEDVELGQLGLAEASAEAEARAYPWTVIKSRALPISLPGRQLPRHPAVVGRQFVAFCPCQRLRIVSQCHQNVSIGSTQEQLTLNGFSDELPSKAHTYLTNPFHRHSPNWDTGGHRAEWQGLKGTGRCSEVTP